MDFLTSFKKNLIHISPTNFETNALAALHFQIKENKTYASYNDHLGRKVESMTKITDIPFLPIDFFKSRQIKTGEWVEQKIFRSSGTTETGRSRHFIQDLTFYHDSSLRHAQYIFGTFAHVPILALLPSYLEQGESSLVEMVRHFMTVAHPNSGFYLDMTDSLVEQMIRSESPMLLFGVSYALLDLADRHPHADLSKHIIIETGGMKGRKKEITSAELHKRLKIAFNHPKIFTEYGMTELLSQAYGKPSALQFPPWAKALVRDLNDPFLIKTEGTGILNVIDLANIHSCAFIETKDLVRLNKSGEFEVYGRVDNTDIRGCNLLIQ